MTDRPVSTEVRPTAAEAPSTLVFGRMYEDAGLDSNLLPSGRVLCIASSGDTAIRLAADGREVLAIDSNPAQIRYVQARLNGAGTRRGSVERLLTRARWVLGRTAWRRADIPSFCTLSDPAEQLRRWRATFDTRPFRTILAAVLSPLSIRSAGFAAFTSGVGGRFDIVMRERLLTGLGRHPNADNPYLKALLLGVGGQPAPAPEAANITLVCADVAAFLEAEPAGSFDGFTLSNVEDGADAAYLQRLESAVRRCAAPGAVSIWRTFRESPDAGERELAAQDRSLFWGGIRVQNY